MARAACKDMGLTGGKILVSDSIEKECIDPQYVTLISGCGEVKSPNFLKQCLHPKNHSNTVCDDHYQVFKEKDAVTQ